MELVKMKKSQVNNELAGAAEHAVKLSAKHSAGSVEVNLLQ